MKFRLNVFIIISELYEQKIQIVLVSVLELEGLIVSLCVWYVSRSMSSSVLLPAHMHVIFIPVCHMPVPHIYICVGQHTHCLMLFMNRLSQLMVHSNLRKAVFQTSAQRTCSMKPTTKWVISVNISRQTGPTPSYHNFLFNFGFTFYLSDDISVSKGCAWSESEEQQLF